jgi:FMN phosphatase YigB (HAD superfamily)
VYVADQLSSDAVAAREAGRAGVWLNGPGETRNRQAAREIGSLLQLPALLEALG